MAVQQQQQQQAVPVAMLTGNASVPAGALFGLPGVTVWSEQKENNDGTTFVPSATTQTTASFPSNFKQTDVVFGWIVSTTVTFGAAPTGTGIALSPYFPYNFLGATALNVQNQFDTYSLLSGFDEAIFQMIRPQRQQSWISNFVDQGNNAATDAYLNPGSFTTATNYTTASTSISFDFDLLPGIWFDLYYDLSENGMLLTDAANGMRTFVSPLMMAGTNRVIQPRVTYNQGGTVVAANSDVTLAPYTVTAGVVTYTTPVITQNFRRIITYQPQSSTDAPLLWNWQYSRQCVRNTIGATAQVTIPLPLVGQILAFYLRFVDPSQATSATQIIPLSTNVSEMDVQIGSGLFRYQDTVKDMQRRFFRQHGVYPPTGVAVWDFATLFDGRVTNAAALNTLTTSGCQVVVNFSVVPGASAYYVLGVEALRYVALQ
jgi:hypothetical protein